MDWLLWKLWGLCSLLLELLFNQLRRLGLLWNSWGLLGLDWSSLSSSICLSLLGNSWLSDLLQLLINDLGVNLRCLANLLGGCLGLGHLDTLGNLLSNGGSNLNGGRNFGNLLLNLLVDVSEDVVQDEVTGWLLGENERLDELLQLGGLVGRLSNDLDDDGLVGGLGVDVRDADLAVLEIEGLDALLDGLDLLT